MEAQIENKADSPDQPMNDRETAGHDMFQRIITRGLPARETRFATAARIQDQDAVGRSFQKIFQFILMYRARGVP